LCVGEQLTLLRISSSKHGVKWRQLVHGVAKPRTRMADPEVYDPVTRPDMPSGTPGLIY